MKCLLVCVAFGVLTAFGYDASTITSVDWSAQSGTYAVPAGQTNLVTETDIGYVNALDSLKFGDAASAVVFISTTAPAVLFEGLGTVVKEGAAAWELTKAQTKSTWKGNWDIREGEVWLCVKDQPTEAGKKQQTLFYISSSAPHTLYIREGAKLVYNSAASFQHVDIRLAGTFQMTGETTDGTKVYRVYSASTSFTRFTIESDAAKIIQDSGNYMWFSRASDDEEVSLDLNGHKLTCELLADIYIYRGTVQGPGTMRLQRQASATKNYYIAIRNSKKSGFTDPSVTLELADGTGVRMEEHPTLPQVAKMVVEGASLFYHSHQGTNKDTIVCPEDGEDSGLFWDGPIELKNADSTLSVYNAPQSARLEDCHASMGLRGPISGPGSLKLGSSGSQTRIYLNCPTNTYTGTTTFKNQTDNAYLVSGSNSVPNAAGVTSDTENLLLRFTGADDDLTLAKIVRMYRDGSYLTSKGEFNVRYLPRFCAADGQAVTLSGEGLSELGDNPLFEPLLVGAGEVRIAAPFGETLFAPRFVDPDNAPTLTLTGTGVATLTNMSASATFDRDGLLRIAGGAQVKLAAAAGFSYGLGRTQNRVQRMEFASGGGLAPIDPCIDAYYADRVTNVLSVGYQNTTGRLDVCNGAVVTGRVMVGNYSSVNQRPRGVLRQTGGELAVIGQYRDSNMLSATFLGNWGQGACSLEGGTLTILGNQCIANYGNAVFHQRGGTFRQVKYPWGSQASSDPVIGVGTYGGTGDLIFSGGRVEMPDTYLYLARRSNTTVDMFASLTVAGDASVRFRCSYAMVDSSHVTVNLLGGVLATSWRTRGGYAPDTLFNFDGGTYRTCANSYTGDFGSIYWNRDLAPTNYPVRMIVGPKGGTFDVATFYENVWVPLDAPEEGRVTAIPWTDTETSYPAPPTVVITGDGRHATAYADYDYTTGKIRGFVVTCGGEGYSHAEVQLEYQRQYYANQTTPQYPDAHEDLLAEPIACVIGAQPVSGGMTFRASGVASGSNYIGLHCTNTYAGATTVDMQYDAETGTPGLLYAYVDDIFPNSHKLVVKSGIMDFRYMEQTSFTELEVTGGKMMNYKSGKTLALETATFAGSSDLATVKLSVSDRLVVDAANPATVAGGTITMGEGSKLTVANAASLANIERGVTLFTYDLQGAVPEVVQPDDLPANVKLTWRNGRLRASRTDIGSMLFVR